MQKTAIITGANDGIGKSMAIAFARRGYRLGLLARRGSLLEETARECERVGSPRVEISVSDVTATPLFRDELIRLDEALSGAEFFVANAGVDAPSRRSQDNSEMARRVIAVNLHAAIVGIELMKVRMIARGHGTLSVVGSVAGARGLPGASIYCATKAAIHAYLESLRIDLGPMGVRVCEIAPGFIDTAMTRANSLPKPFMIPADRAGEIFVQRLIRGHSLIVAPWQYAWALRALRLAPSWLYEPLAARMAPQEPMSIP